MSDWAEIRAAGICNAERTLSDRHDAVEIRKLIRDWLGNSSSIEGAAASQTTITTADLLECRGLGEVAEALRLIDQHEGVIPSGRWLLALLIGYASADLFAEGLARGQRSSYDLKNLESYGAWSAFTCELPELLRSNAVAQAGFWRELTKVVEEVRVEPERCAMLANHEGVRNAIQTYQITPNIGDAFNVEIESYVLLEDRFLFTLACALDPKRLLAQLERLPHPVFVTQCVDGLLSDGLPDLIRSASPAYDETGTYRAEGMVLIALLQASATECRRQAWGGPDTPSPVNVEKDESFDLARVKLEAFVDANLDALFSRPDAVTVGWLWLERLIFEGECCGFWHCDRQQRTDLVLDPLMILVGRLAARLNSRTDRLEWVREARDLWRVHRVAAILAVEVSGKSVVPGDVERRFRELVTALEPAYAGAAAAIQRTDCIIGRIGGAHVLSATEPGRFVETLWDELRPVRERAWRSAHGVRNEAAELAILCAVCAMETAAPEVRRNLWLSLRDVLESAMQTDYPSSHSEFWPAALRRLCHSASDVLTGSHAHDLDILAELMRPRAHADALLFEMAFALEHAGVDRKLIQEAVARWGVELAELARRYLIMEGLKIGSGYFGKPWLEKIHQLAREGRARPGTL